MAKTPIEMILDGVEWVAAEGDAPTNGASDLPYVTHSGVLQIAEHSLKCFRLSDGQAVFDAEDFERFFGAMNDSPHRSDSASIVDDGFGNSWSIVCVECKRPSMKVVRPGKVQCGYCG